MSRVKLTLPDQFGFSTEIPVRISDINYGGHLGNDAVLSLAQEARIRFLKHYGMTEHDAGGVGIIMTDAVVLYRSETFHGDLLRIDVAVADLETHGCDIVYRIIQAGTGKEVARVKTGIVFFDYTSRKVVGVPDRFRSTFTSPTQSG